MDVWKKCFSRSRNREYYFNEKTGKSVWTVEETQTTKSNEESNPKKTTEAETSNKKSAKLKRLSKASDTKPITSKTLSAKIDPDQLAKIVIKTNPTIKKNTRLIKNEEKQDPNESEPMELDDLIENV